MCNDSENSEFHDTIPRKSYFKIVDKAGGFFAVGIHFTHCLHYILSLVLIPAPRDSFIRSWVNYHAVVQV